MVAEQLLFSSVFIAGLLSFFSPCILPLLPVYISILSSNEEGTKDRLMSLGKWQVNLQLVMKTIIFVMGLSTSFVLLGFGAGFLGAVINTQWFIVVCGIVVIVLGLHQVGLFNVAWLNREKKEIGRASCRERVF